MLKRLLCCMLVLVMCFSVVLVAEARQASGRCSMSTGSRNVSYSGYSTSAQTEDEIKVSVRLMEKRGSTWYEVSSSSKTLTNTDYVSTAATKNVTGGYNYKVIGTYTSKKNGTTYSVSSETIPVWIA